MEIQDILAGIVETEGTAVARELHDKHISAVTSTHATVEKPRKLCLLYGPYRDRLDKPSYSEICSESEVGVRWFPTCEDVSPEAEGRPPLEAVTEQRD
jgi:hypothetical protein